MAERQARTAARRELEERILKIGTAEEQHAVQLEREREKRVEELQRLAVHRIKQLALTRGWNSWLSKHEERRRVEQLLRHAAGRMRQPKLVASLSHWTRRWEAAMLAAEKEAFTQAHEREKLEQRAALEAARREQEQLRAQHLSDDAKLALKMEQEREQRIEHLQRVAAGRIAQLALARGWSSWL